MKDKDKLQIEDIKKVQDMLVENEVPEPYIIVTPKPIPKEPEWKTYLRGRGYKI